MRGLKAPPRQCKILQCGDRLNRGARVGEVSCGERGGARLTYSNRPTPCHITPGVMLTDSPPCRRGSSSALSRSKRSRSAIPLPRVEDEAGDDDHGRHLQRLRERFRGRLFGGFLHAENSLDLVMSHRCLRRPDGSIVVTRNTPRRVSAMMSPHSANIDSAKIEQQYGGNLTRTCRDLRTFPPMKRQTDAGAAAQRHDGLLDGAGGCCPVWRPIVFSMNLLLDRTA